jgi:hypothetical protein
MTEKKIYYINSDNPDKSIDIEFFGDLFKKNSNWRPYDINDKKIDFSYVIGKYKDIKTDISYHFTTSHRKYLTNKSILWKTIKNYDDKFYNKYMVRHFEIDPENIEMNKDIFIDIFKNNKMIIIRPDWTFERSGISIINNFESFKNYMNKKGKYIYDNINKRYPNEKHNFIASEYIQNVLLYKNKVTDFRVFFLISYINNTYRSYLIKPIIMNLGQFERTKFNIHNIKENITTAHGTTDNYLKDLIPEIGKENYNKIKNQILQILSVLFKIIKKHKIMELYNDQNGAYEVFGLDFVSDDKYNVKLIEFNEKTGLGNYEDFIYQNIANCIINGTVNKLDNDKYHIELDNNIRNKFIKIRSNKNYL